MTNELILHDADGLLQKLLDEIGRENPEARVCGPLWTEIQRRLRLFDRQAVEQDDPVAATARLAAHMVVQLWRGIGGRAFSVHDSRVLGKVLFDFFLSLNPSARETPDKYGTFSNLLNKLYPGEPWFVFLARDKFSPEMIRAYHHALHDAGLTDQATGVAGRLGQFLAWQEQNPDKVKLPT